MYKLYSNMTHELLENFDTEDEMYKSLEYDYPYYDIDTPDDFTFILDDGDYEPEDEDEELIEDWWKN